MGPVVSNVVTLLALYFAALILAVQHVSDHYSPALAVPVLVRRASAPLAVLLGLVVLALLVPTGSGGAADAVMMGAILAGLGGSFYLWSGLGDGERIARLLHTVRSGRREPAVREVLWNAAQRANPPVAAVALRVFPADSPEQDGLLRWLADHREVLAKEWMARELAAVLLPPDGTAAPGGERSRVLEMLLVDVLDRGDHDRALLVLDAVMEALALTDPWTPAHADLLHAFGFALWNVGVPGESVPRTAGVQPRLGGVQSVFHQRLMYLRRHLLGLRDSEAVEFYAHVLGALAAETGDGFVLTCLYEVMEGGFRERLWTEQALHQLGSDLGFARRGRGAESGDPAFEPERIDALAITGAAMLVELYGEDDLERYLGNALLFKGSLRHAQEQEWLKPESHAAVERELSRR